MEALNYVRGQIFMSILTLLLMVITVLVVYFTIQLFRKRNKSIEHVQNKIPYIRVVGLLALVIGMLDQLIGLHVIMKAIEEAGDITAGIVLSAITASMIPLIYSIAIFIFSLCTWLILDITLKSKIKRIKIT